MRLSASSEFPSLLLCWSSLTINRRSVYKTSELVTAICVHASSNANKPMAVRCSPPHLPSTHSPIFSQVIFPQEVALRTLAGKGDVDFDKLCEDPAVQKAVLAELNAIGKQEGLKPLEVSSPFFCSERAELTTSAKTLQCVILSSIEWTAANGLLTAAQKLQRRAIISEFKSKIDVRSSRRFRVRSLADELARNRLSTPDRWHLLPHISTSFNAMNTKQFDVLSDSRGSCHHRVGFSDPLAKDKSKHMQCSNYSPLPPSLSAKRRQRHHPQLIEDLPLPNRRRFPPPNRSSGGV